MLALTEGGHQVHIASGLYHLTCKVKEWTGMRMDNVGGDVSGKFSNIGYQ